MAEISTGGAVYLLVVLVFIVLLYEKGKKKYTPLCNALNQKEYPLRSMTMIGFALMELIQYKYNTVIEDSLSKMSCFTGLEQYRGSNEYRAKADKIREANEALSSFEDLRKAGMGKESLKRLLAWISEDKKLKISKKGLISDIGTEDIPDEIRIFFEEIKKAMI